MRTWWSSALLVLLPLCALAEKQPADARLLDVTRVEFGAIPDDGLDDYAAIKKAMGAYDGFNGNTLYFPCGVYNFSSTIEFRDWTGTKLGTPPNDNWPWTVGIPWMGERQDCVTIKLDDNAVGFGDPNNPKPFVETGSLVGPSSSDKGLSGDHGNGAYQNSIEDLTIDCGSGNPGARCLDWLASNAGEIRNVTVKSDDGQGFAGVYLGRAWPGPCMLYNVTVQGFAYGIYLLQSQYSVTFLNTTLSGQSTAGFFIGGNMASIDKLTSTQTADIPAVLNNDGGGQIELLHATLTGPVAATSPAIVTHASVKYYMRDITTVNYPSAIKKGTTVVATGPTVTQAVSNTINKLYNTPDNALDLPVEYPPDPYWVSPDDHPELWANVLSYGAGNGIGGELTNDVAGIQAAMNSGRPIVYFPKLEIRPSAPIAGADGTYALLGPTITVPGTVRRVLFNRNTIYVKKTAYTTSSSCVFTVIGTDTDPPVEFNYMRRGGDSIEPAKHICNRSSGRKVVIRSSPSALNYWADGPGTTWVVDVIGAMRATNGATVYAWQLNQENGAGSSLIPPTAVVDGIGTTFYNVGMKTEGDFTIANVTGGAKYALFGGFIFPCIGTGTNPVHSDGVSITDSQASVSLLQYCTKNPAIQDYTYPRLVAQTVGDTTRYLRSTQTINQLTCCSNRNYMPLFNALPSDLKIYPELDDATRNIVVPGGPLFFSYKMATLDPSGLAGVPADPGMWTQPASCQGMADVTFTVTKEETATGDLDVDLYSCQDMIGGPAVGLFDPKAPYTSADPKNCRLLTGDVVLDGVGSDPGTAAEFHYTGPMGKMVARVVTCNGDCRAQINLQCSRN